jgi:hypothetical protein
LGSFISKLHRGVAGEIAVAIICFWEGGSYSHYSIVFFLMFVLVEKLQLLLSLFYDAKNHLDIVGKDIYVYFKKNVKYAMSAEYSQNW